MLPPLRERPTTSSFWPRSFSPEIAARRRQACFRQREAAACTWPGSVRSSRTPCSAYPGIDRAHARLPACRNPKPGIAAPVAEAAWGAGGARSPTSAAAHRRPCHFDGSKTKAAETLRDQPEDALRRLRNARRQDPLSTAYSGSVRDPSSSGCPVARELPGESQRMPTSRRFSALRLVDPPVSSWISPAFGFAACSPNACRSNGGIPPGGAERAT
jgi:hypothetical protein